MKKSHILMIVATIAVLFFSNVSAKEALIHSDGIPDFPRIIDEENASLMADEEYVSLMTDDEDEELEKLLLNAWDNLEPSIDVSAYDITIAEYKSSQSRYNTILEDNPVYMLLTKGTSDASTYDGEHIYYIYPRYTITNLETAKQLKNAIDEEAEDILFNITDTMSDFDKIMAVHDYMALHYSYDTTYQNHSISIMTTKTGVCQAYAYAFKHMMNILGIDCTYVKSDPMAHMWNLVKLDDKWYHIDLTWDDPVPDTFGQVRHNYALKSTDAFMCTTYPDSPHDGFDLGELKANSKKYDDSDWHPAIGSIVHCNGITYWWEGDDLMDENGNDIVDDIIGNRKWKINKYFTFKDYDSIFAGLATHNGKLYYNSDSAIYCYDPATKKTETIKSQIGLCGLFIDKNTLYYTVSEITASNSIAFKKGGEIQLEEFSIGGSYREDKDTVVTRICNTSEAPVTVFLFDGNKAKTEICESGVSKVEMETDAPTYVFVWDSNLKPLAKKTVIE